MSEDKIKFISLGFWNCPKCSSEKFSNTEGCSECGLTAEEAQIYQEPSFSSSSCDLCNSHLGGDRYPAIGWEEDEEGEVHYVDEAKWSGEICVDCVLSL